MIFLFVLFCNVVTDRVYRSFAINNTRPLEYIIKINYENDDVVNGVNVFIRAKNNVICDLYLINETNKIFSWNGTKLNKYIQTQKLKEYILLISTQLNEKVKFNIYHEGVFRLGTVGIVGFTFIGVFVGTGIIIVVLIVICTICYMFGPVTCSNLCNYVKNIKKRRIKKYKKSLEESLVIQ
jgi:hypothetical protein